MKNSLIALALTVTYFSSACTAEKSAGNEELGRDQVVSVKDETKPTFLWFNPQPTGNVVVTCKGVRTADVMTRSEYEAKMASGSICPSRAVKYTHSASFCRLKLAVQGITTGSVPDSVKSDLKTAAKNACLADRATSCELEDISLGTCFEAPVLDTSSPAGIIAASQGCFSTEFVAKETCSLSVTVKGISASTNTAR